MSKPFSRANQLAKQVFTEFMEQVIDQHVLNEHRSPMHIEQKNNDPKPLDPKQKQAILDGKEIDVRTLYLMRLSGKGGFSNDPEKFARYRENSNITLLDHMLSVTRGALVLAVLSWLQADSDMDESAAIERLKVLAVTAFLHDLDKILQLPRNEALTLEHVESVMQRYGITKFLGDIELSAEQLRFLIEQVETSQAFRHPCKQEPKRSYTCDAKRYAQLADKLDGLWCADGSRQGLDNIVAYMQGSNALASDMLSQWQAVDIFDPHHPFLLDELQRNLSFACRMESGIPPLLETHQDGRLFMLLPGQVFDTVLDRGMQRFLEKGLPFDSEKIEIIFVQGKPKIKGGQPTYPKLTELVEEELSDSDVSKIFNVKKALKSVTSELDVLLGSIDLKPRWLEKTNAALVSPYPNPSELNISAQKNLRKAAKMALSLKFFTNKKTLKKCSQQLIEQLDETLPSWIQDISDSDSYIVMLSLWCLSVTCQKTEKKQIIWGGEGLLKVWLEGDVEQQCLTKNLSDDTSDIQQTVKRYYKQLLHQQRVFPVDESQIGRCLFTDMPVSTKSVIRQELGLYEVNATAFTGREGKPDSIIAPTHGEVHISFVSRAEHKLRQRAFSVQGGEPSGVPTLVSSPVTTGLFAALVLDDKETIRVLSRYDITRKMTKKGKSNFKGLEAYHYRMQIMRLERIPERLVSSRRGKKNEPGQIEVIHLMLQVCLRVGRPLHLFRGLPTPQKAFFYFDAMPRILQNLIDTNELRLEQIPPALKRLEIAETISSAAGLGYDVLTLYALKKTRFAASALVWGYAEDRLEDKKLGNSMRYLQNQMIQSQQESEMSEQDGVLVRLGQAATVIQFKPATSAHSKELLVFNLCMDAAIGLLGMKQHDRNSLVNGIADELAINLKRKGEEGFGLSREDKLDEACLTFAEQFVDEVWFGVLAGKPPAQKERRLLGAVYRMAFIQAHRQAAKQRKAEKADQASKNDAQKMEQTMDTSEA